MIKIRKVKATVTKRPYTKYGIYSEIYRAIDALKIDEAIEITFDEPRRPVYSLYMNFRGKISIQNLSSPGASVVDKSKVWKVTKIA